MDLISSTNIVNESYHISNKKNYTRNQKYYNLSNIVHKFNAENFAKWMQTSFANSKFKKQVDLVKFVKSNPATISRLMTGTAQTINGKPSQPDKELVTRLAEAFEQNVDEVLQIAGYAPLSQIQVIRERIKVSDFDEFDDKDLDDIAEYIALKKLKNEKGKE